MARKRGTPRWQQRMKTAESPAAELEAAYDRLRSAAARMCRSRRDVVRQAEAVTLTASVLHDAAADLARHATRITESETRRGVAQ